jgi:hypothetical protein
VRFHITRSMLAAIVRADDILAGITKILNLKIGVI